MLDFLKRKQPERKKFSFYSEEAERSYRQIVDDVSSCRLILFTENWVALMEDKIKNGLFTKECIEETRKQADKLCKSKGKDYFIAKHLLIVHWKYGDYLENEKDKKFYKGKEHSGKFYAKRKRVY